MNLWYKIDNINKLCYKQMFIKHNQDIQMFYQYLNKKNQLQINHVKQYNQTQTVQIIDSQGNKIKANYELIYPSLNFQSIYQFQGSNNIQIIIQSFIQSYNKQFQQQNKSLFDSLNINIIRTLINPPNILKCIQLIISTSKQQYFLKINDQFSFYLKNQQLSSRAQNKMIEAYYQQIIQRFFMVKNNKHLNCYILSGNFISSLFNSKQQQQSRSIKNQQIVQHKNYLKPFFIFLDNHKKSYWQYQQLSLLNIYKLYEIFLNQCQFKLSVYFDQKYNKIHKIQVIPFIRLSQKNLARNFINIIFKQKYQKNDLRHQNVKIQGKIFQILLNSTQETKNFYKIPLIQEQKKSHNNEDNISLQALIQLMSKVGFKMSEISPLIRNFSLTLNLSLLQIYQQLHQNQYRQYKSIKFLQDIAYKNINSLYSHQFESLKKLLLGEANFQGYYQQQKKITLIKKQILTQILWQQCISRFTQQINIKLEDKKFNRNKNKMKQFSIFCLSNSFTYRQNNKSQISITQSSIQQTQYFHIGYKLLSQQLKKYQKFQPYLSTNQFQQSASYVLKQSITSKYQLKIQKDFSSLNRNILKQKLLYDKLYYQLKRSEDVEQFIDYTFHNEILYDPYDVYYEEIYKIYQDQNDQNVFNCYIIEIDCYEVKEQNKYGQRIVQFVEKVLQEDYINSKKEELQQQEDVCNIQSNKQSSINIQSIRTSRLHNQSSQGQNNNSPINTYKRPLTIMTPKSNSKSSLLNTPKQPNTMRSSLRSSRRMQNISTNFVQFIQKYLYCEQVKKIYRIVKPDQFKKQKSFKFNYQKVKQFTEDCFFNYLQSKSYYVEDIIPFNLIMNTSRQNVQIQISRKVLENLQFDKGLHKNYVKKIINLFRKFKFRRNHKKYFDQLARKKKLKQILNNLTYLIKKKQFNKFKVHLSFTILRQLILKRFKMIKKQIFQQLKFQYILDKMFRVINSIYRNLNLINKRIGFQKIRDRCNRKNAVFRLFYFLQCKIKSIQQQTFDNFVRGPYQLVVTTPGGNKKNPQYLKYNYPNIPQKQQKPVLLIDVVNVNNTAILDSGNTSTSNVRNSLSKQKNNDQSFFKFNSPKKFIKQEIPEEIPQKQSDKKSLNQNQNNNSNLQRNELFSILSGSLVSYKSDKVQNLTKSQLLSLTDKPNFSFQSWAKQIGTIIPNDQKKPCEILFKKYEQGKLEINKQSQLKIDEQRALKQKIYLNTFETFANQNLNKTQTQSIWDILTCQKTSISKPILKHYNIAKHGSIYQQMFNNILKISLYKNTSKKIHDLLNLILKPIRQAYKKQKQNHTSIFDDQPLVLNSYTSDYNVLLDQMFLQFVKQFLTNTQKASMKNISLGLQFITQHYYPSIKMMYPYLNYIKILELKNNQIFGKIYENLLLFAQAVQGTKSNILKVYKGGITKVQTQCIQYLQPRASVFSKEQVSIQGKIYIKLFNQQIFQFKVRNQSFKTIKKKLLNILGFLQKQSHFSLCQQISQNFYIRIDQKLKIIDLLNGYTKRQNLNKDQPYILYLRIIHYYPIKFKDINSLRMFYLNMIGQQSRYPWRQQDYQHIVALSINFDQFQQQRISHYMTITKKQGLKQPDIANIKKKLAVISANSQKKICQFEYFKSLKDFNFLLAKSYIISNNNQLMFNQIDKIIIKPKQLCFYSSTKIKASISLYRIKSFYFEKEQISIQLVYSDRDIVENYDRKFFGVTKYLSIKGFENIKQLYQDIVYYTELLQLGVNRN